MHINNGLELLDRADYEGAYDAFSRAVDMDKKNPMSLSYKGLTMIYAYPDSVKPAGKLLKRAFAYDEENEYAYLLQGFLEIPADMLKAIVTGKLENKTKQAAAAFEKALKRGKGNYRIEYLAAKGYEKILDFTSAKALYTDLSKEGPYISSALVKLDYINNIERLSPQTELGKAVAFLSDISRGEAAGVIVREVNPGRHLKKSEPGTLPADAEDHWAKLYIEELLSAGIMETDKSGSFSPNQNFTRSDFAMLYLRLMVGFTNDPSLAAKYLDSEMGYKDLPPAHPVFNAARITVENGLLKAENGYFRPDEAVSGIEILEMTSWIRKNYERSF